MNQNPDKFQGLNVEFLVGSKQRLEELQHIKPLEPFCKQVEEFLNILSRRLLSDKEAKAYPDVITFAFWIRKAAVAELKRRFMITEDNVYRLGRGIVFHIAPSNVPVNYAYSLVAGLICGNANIVRISSKFFPQVEVINRAIREILEEYQQIAPYIILVRYEHDKQVNDIFSSMADVRIVWGGDATIREIRKSMLNSRATEITFADRYSLAVIDSDVYLEMDHMQVARDFYNDTYLTDQNACTSPRVVAWLGTKVGEAKKRFWDALYQLVKGQYKIQGIQAVNKLASSCLLAISAENVKKIAMPDNLLVRMQVEKVNSALIDLKNNSGYFIETDCQSIADLFDFCDDIHCQTISYLGDKELFKPLLEKHPRGIDRIVPVGKTMDFDLLWDGYNLYERMTRAIVML